jgi:hypothetical protein
VLRRCGVVALCLTHQKRDEKMKIDGYERQVEQSIERLLDGNLASFVLAIKNMHLNVPCSRMMFVKVVQSTPCGTGVKTPLCLSGRTAMAGRHVERDNSLSGHWLEWIIG